MGHNYYTVTVDQLTDCFDELIEEAMGRLSFQDAKKARKYILKKKKLCTSMFKSLYKSCNTEIDRLEREWTKMMNERMDRYG